MHTEPRPMSDAAEPDPSALAGRRWLLPLGITIMLTEGWCFGALGTTAPSLLKYAPWHATTDTVGLLGGVFAAGMPLGALLAGRASDTWGRRLPVAICLLWVSVSMVITGLAPSLQIFAAGLGLTGMALGGLTTLTIAFVADSAPAEHSALHVGLAQCGVAIGGVIIPFFGRMVLPDWPFQSIFLIGALPVLLIPACRLIPAAGDQLAHTEVRAPLRALRTPAVLRMTGLFAIASFFVLLLVSAVAVWLPSLLVHRGFDLRSALGITVAANIGAVAGTLAATTVASKGRAKAAILGCLGCAGVAALALSVVDSTWLVLAMAALAGVGSYGTQNMLNGYIAASYPTRMRGTALGVTIGLGRVGAVAGPVYISAVTGTFTGPTAGFYALIVPAVVAAALVALIRPSQSISEWRPAVVVE